MPLPAFRPSGKWMSARSHHGLAFDVGGRHGLRGETGHVAYPLSRIGKTPHEYRVASGESQPCFIAEREEKRVKKAPMKAHSPMEVRGVSVVQRSDVTAQVYLRLLRGCHSFCLRRWTFRVDSGLSPPSESGSREADGATCGSIVSGPVIPGTPHTV